MNAKEYRAKFQAATVDPAVAESGNWGNNFKTSPAKTPNSPAAIVKALDIMHRKVRKSNIDRNKKAEVLVAQLSCISCTFHRNPLVSYLWPDGQS